MSALAQTFGSPQVVAVGGTDLYLPPAARLDLAYEYDYLLPGAGLVGGWLFDVPQGTYEIPIYVQFHLQTSATAGTRAPTLLRLNAADTVLWEATANVGIGSTKVVDVVFACGTAASSGPVGLTYVTPFMSTVGKYTDQWRIADVSSTSASDVWENLVFRTLRVPTGPPLSAPSPSVPSLQLI